VAEGQARAPVDLLASFAVRGPVKREILLAVDEFSAVSRRLPIWQLYERARSLGLAVQVSAQSWQGLGTNPDERLRIAASAEGGIWLLRTPNPEPVTALAGTLKSVDTTRHLRRFPLWSHKGSSRVRDIPVVDPTLIRTLDVGQVAYIYRGGVTYIQVKRLVATPVAVTAVPAATPASDSAATPSGGSRRLADSADAPDGRPGTVAAPRDDELQFAGSAAAALPDIGPLLDAAFGPERTS
jgi:hypothetical protein